VTPRSRTVLIGAGVSLLLFLVMGLIVANTDPWQADNGSASANNTAQANDLTGVTGSLFGPDVIAFEVLGILLTAAMIGALVIARPLDAPTDESRYSHPTVAQVAESDHASDVASSPGLKEDAL
jgi:hypothetical protein